MTSDCKVEKKKLPGIRNNCVLLEPGVVETKKHITVRIN